MAQQNGLIALAQEAEDAASGLHAFRDRLPRYATHITAIVSELFAVSSVLREIEHARLHPEYQPSFYRIREDITLLFRSLQSSLENVFIMFRRSGNRTHQVVWEDLRYRMETEEGVSLRDRLVLYHDFLDVQLDIVNGRGIGDTRRLRRPIEDLWDAQEQNGIRTPRRAISESSTLLKLNSFCQ
jgi:hypothetical protein